MAEIVDRMDAGVLLPRTHDVTSVLAEHLRNLSPLSTEVIEAFRAGSSVGNDALLRRLWEEIEGLPQHQQGGRRLLVSLLHPNAHIDGYHAGYIIDWSRDEGVPDEVIIRALGQVDARFPPISDVPAVT